MLKTRDWDHIINESKAYNGQEIMLFVLMHSRDKIP